MTTKLFYNTLQMLLGLNTGDHKIKKIQLKIKLKLAQFSLMFSNV